MNDILRIARLRIALQRAFLGRAILRVIKTQTTEYRATQLVKSRKFKLSHAIHEPGKIEPVGM